MSISGSRPPVDPQAVLFDLDDTLITDGGISDKTWQEVCREFAPLTGGVNAAELYKAISRVTAVYWGDPENHRRGRLDLPAARRYVVGQAFRDLGLNEGGISVELADRFSLKKDQAITLVDGALDILKLFKERGWPLALLTNGGSVIQRWKIERFELAPYFDIILIEGEYGVGKPDQRVFTEALRKLKAPAAGAWMVGDDLERDIAGAQKLGICTIWMDWKKTGLPPSSAVKPQYIIRSLLELA
jgi:putative hydrolase of the HAD superfamily